MDNAAGYKNRRRKRKPRTMVQQPSDDACTTCSVCQSKLARFSDINKLHENLAAVNVPAGASLNCAACGSALTHLRDFAK